MAPKYKLSYFDMMGLGEPIRFLLSYGKIEFEDHRISRNDWPSVRPTLPFGQLPILEVDGKKMYQSLAICRYLGKQFGLSGNSNWEDLEIDMTAATINDLRLKLAQYFYESDETIKEKRKGPLYNEHLPFYMPKLDNQVKENEGYLAAHKLSWADLYFVSLIEHLKHMAGFDIIKDYPNLTALCNKVNELPNIKEWLSKRPHRL